MRTRNPQIALCRCPECIQEWKRIAALLRLKEADPAVKALRKIADTDSSEGYLRDIRGGNADIARAALDALGVK